MKKFSSNDDIRNSQAFDPKALQDLVEQYGQIKEGEEPRARDVALPKKTAERKFVPRNVRTVDIL